MRSLRRLAGLVGVLVALAGSTVAVTHAAADTPADTPAAPATPDTRTGTPAATSATPEATEPPQLALDQDFPDPDILKVGDTFYVYATNSGGKTLPVASAPSMDGPWTVQAEEALPALGAWASPGYTWAPDVSRLDDGRFLLYYTARHTASDRQCIGAALADSPRGPFQPVGTEPLVCPVEEGGAIDAASFVDTDGQRYLLYKNDGNAIGVPTTIYLQPVAADGITFTGDRVGLVSNDGDEGWLVEAPSLRRSGDTYVLLYATGEYWNETYATRYATATSVAGPYTKVDRPLLSTASFDNAVQGPGGADVLQDAEAGDHIVFHGVREGGYRALYVADLGWAADGVPVVRGSRFRTEAETGTVHNCQVRSGAAGASGGSVVAYIDHADSYVDLEVYAPTAGGYTIRAGYANGSIDANGAGQTATHSVSVNGTAAGAVTYPYTGWDNWSEAAIDVELAQGWNTVRFQHGDWYTELDYVDVA